MDLDSDRCFIAVLEKYTIEQIVTVIKCFEFFWPPERTSKSSSPQERTFDCCKQSFIDVLHFGFGSTDQLNTNPRHEMYKNVPIQR